MSSNGALVQDFLSNITNLNKSLVQHKQLPRNEKSTISENMFVTVVADSFKEIEPGTILVYSLHAIAGLYYCPAAKSSLRNVFKGIEISKKNILISAESTTV